MLPHWNKTKGLGAGVTARVTARECARALPWKQCNGFYGHGPWALIRHHSSGLREFCRLIRAHINRRRCRVGHTATPQATHIGTYFPISQNLQIAARRIAWQITRLTAHKDQATPKGKPYAALRSCAPPVRCQTALPMVHVCASTCDLKVPLLIYLEYLPIDRISI